MPTYYRMEVCVDGQWTGYWHGLNGDVGCCLNETSYDHMDQYPDSRCWANDAGWRRMEIDICNAIGCCEDDEISYRILSSWRAPGKVVWKDDVQALIILNPRINLERLIMEERSWD